MSKKYTVYMHINKINGKKYVGITCTSAKRRWRNGLGYDSQIFRLAIKKYGWDAFEHIILFQELTKNEACTKEIELIKQYQSSNPEFGYNVSLGANTGSMKEETKEKLRKLNLGKVLSDEHRLKISTSNKGKQFTQEHLENLSKSHIGNTGFWTGKKRSNETIDKVRKKLSKPVLCIETGEIFSSVTEASKKTNYPISCIAKWCRGLKSKYADVTFMYLQQEGG